MKRSFICNILLVLHMILRDEVYFLPVDSDTCLLSSVCAPFQEPVF